MNEQSFSREELLQELRRLQHRVAELEAAEEVRQESEQRYRIINETISDYAFSFHRQADGTFVLDWLTESFTKLTGYPVESLLGKPNPFHTYVHPDDLDLVMQTFATMPPDEPATYDFRIVTKAGEVRWLHSSTRAVADETGQIMGFYGATRDITDRKQIEEALRQEKDFSERLVNTAQAIILVLDPEGRIVRFNSYTEELTGYTLDEVRGRDWVTTFLLPDDQPRIRAIFVQILANREIRNSVNAIITKTGQARDIEWSAKILHDAHGHPIGFLSVGLDITDRKRDAEALATLSRQVLEAQETERRALAHELHGEFGQQLTALKLTLQGIKGLPDAAAEQMEDGIERVNDLLHQVRSLSLDLRPSMLDELGLPAALDWYTKRQAQLGGLTIHLIIESLDPRPSSLIETTCFRVVQEALTNIVRHAEAKEVWVELRQEDTTLALRVRDDGVGFDVAAAQQRARHGNSFGVLGMAERIRLVDGQIAIDSTPNTGTTIQARMPLSTQVTHGDQTALEPTPA